MINYPKTDRKNSLGYSSADKFFAFVLASRELNEIHAFSSFELQPGTFCETESPFRLKTAEHAAAWLSAHWAEAPIGRETLRRLRAPLRGIRAIEFGNSHFIFQLSDVGDLFYDSYEIANFDVKESERFCLPVEDWREFFEEIPLKAPEIVLRSAVPNLRSADQNLRSAVPNLKSADQNLRSADQNLRSRLETAENSSKESVQTCPLCNPTWNPVSRTEFGQNFICSICGLNLRTALNLLNGAENRTDLSEYLQLPLSERMGGEGLNNFQADSFEQKIVDLFNETDANLFI